MSDHDYYPTEHEYIIVAEVNSVVGTYIQFGPSTAKAKERFLRYFPEAKIILCY